MMELRPYQQEAVEAVQREFGEGRTRTLLVMPTGTGKTPTAGALLDSEIREHGGRGLFLAHRDELLTQAQSTFERAFGLPSALEKAEQTSLGSPLPLTVASVQTLCREKRLEQFPPEHFSEIVIDEAHHSLGESYRAVLDHFPAAKLVGITATPDRGDKRSLSALYDSVAYEYTMRQAVEDGYLVPIRAKMLPLQADLRKAKVSCGDYTASSVGEALEPFLEQAAGEMLTWCRGRKTVVFLPLVHIAKKFCALLQSAGLRAAEVDGESEDRAELLAAFAAGEFDVICNSMLLTEGWDCPSVDCVVVLRPTKVRSLYQQMVGRGTRLSPGKTELLLLDFLYQTEKHDLCTPANAFGAESAVADGVEKLLLSSDGALDLQEAEEKATRDVLREREEALAAKLETAALRKSKTVDPLQFALSIEAEDLAFYEPTFAWEFQPPTQKQLETLDRLGISPASVRTKGYASLLIDRLIRRREAKLSTPRQIQCLQRCGFEHVSRWTFAQASSQIERLSQNNWRN